VIAAIVGPTGTGKTALALALAERIGAEIVNADSRQVYRGLDIGSAKPSLAERVRVPHHLYDVVAPDEPFDCARYRELAMAAIADVEARGRHVLLVGGTGLYLKVVRYGLFAGPRRDRELREKLEALEDARPGSLHEQLRAVDPAGALRIHAHDRVRLVRALEVRELTGRPISEWQAEHGFRDAAIDCRMIGLAMERRVLYERIDARCRRMADEGLVGEVRSLLAQYDAALGPLQSIGYREIGGHVRGEVTLDAALDAMARATRRFAKRQLTWFRADPTIEWVDAAQVDASELERVLQSQCSSAT
jgi:tRNA dimethylallyltransferase